MTTYFDAKTSMELLSYLGYNFHEENLSSAFNGKIMKFCGLKYIFQMNSFFIILVTRPKEIDINKKQTNRNVFLCYVYGRKKCGKVIQLVLIQN